MIREKKVKRSRVALAITRKTGRPVGLDTATHLEMDADFSVREDRTTPEHERSRRPIRSTNSWGSCRVSRRELVGAEPAVRQADDEVVVENDDRGPFRVALQRPPLARDRRLVLSLLAEHVCLERSVLFERLQ